jgi:plasmid stabilization system protein ParE
MFRLRWSERAAKDFEDILDFIGHENPVNARLVRDRILKSVANLEFFSLGQPGPNGTLKLYIPKTSYFVIFRRDNNGDIGIRAFVHAARDWHELDWGDV